MSNDTDNEMNEASMAFSSGIAAFEAKNFAQAMVFLRQVADTGDAEAQHRCAIMFQNGLGTVANEGKAFEYMKAAAEQGHAVAQHGLGFMYMEGECVEQSGADAVKWFEKAAGQGLMTTLAMMYEEGKGVDKNPEEAKRLYKLAGFDQ
jgi:TPR repeat protein